MPIYLMSVAVSPGFTSMPTLNPVCFSFFYAYGVGKCLFIVLEEPVGHGIACLCVFPPGLCPQIGTITGSAGSEDIPYLFIRMLGMLRNVSVESRYEGNFPCIVKGR